MAFLRVGAAALLLLPIVGCQHHRDCKAYVKQEQRLTYDRDTAADGSPEKRQAALTVAEFVVHDTTGCATAEDKAKARADLDTLH